MKCTFRLKPNEVPEIVVSALSLWHLVLGLWLYGMDDIRELDGILDEENGHVVADEIPISFLCVELHGKSTNITNSVLNRVNVSV